MGSPHESGNRSLSAASPPTDEVSPPAVRLKSATGLLIALAGLYALIGGLLTLVGWFFDLPRLADWRNDGIAMFVNTAICALLGGAGLLCLRWNQSRWLAMIFGGAVALIGGLTLFQHLTGMNLGIDTLLVNRPWGQRAAAAPMRMGPPASISFTLIGVGLFLRATGRPSLGAAASRLGVAAIAIAMLSLIGYLYGGGAERLYTLPHLTGIAIQTATMIFALGVGLVASVPDRGLTRLLGREDAGGLLMRRLLLPIVLIPIVIGGLRLSGEKAGLYDESFGTAILVLVMIGCFFGLLTWTAGGLSRADQDRREQERALRESEQAQRILLDSERAARMEVEQTARAKDDFLATVSHELRSPLNIISGWSQILQRSAIDSAAVVEASKAIDAAVRGQARIIDDLLDANRISSGKLRLDIADVDLAAVINDALDGVRADAVACGIRLESRIDRATGRIMGDADRLRQLVSNLLSNAVNFTQPGGRIEVTLEPFGASVEIRVSDTGRGIKPEYLSRIFERFAQANGAVPGRQRGLGLGLAIAKSIAELHGGAVFAESPGEGKGATFHVRLPLTNLDATLATTSIAPRGGELELAGVQALVVDDDVSAAELLAKLLTAAGATVKLADRGCDALAEIRAFEPDVLICDISMPELDGYQVVRRLRSEGVLIPAIAVTAFARPEDRDRALKAGFSAHLPKPVDIRELTVVVRAHAVADSRPCEAPARNGAEPSGCAAE